MTTFAPTAIRASELSRCARMAVYRGLGAEAFQPDEQTLRYFARGHLYTDYVCRQLEQKHGKENVQREVEIEWPLGVGHADAYLPTEKLLVEIKSTVAPHTSSPMFDMAVEQLRIYLRYHGEAESGALYLINPSDLSREDAFVVNLTDEDRERIDETVALAQQGLESGGIDMPKRVCRKPGDARSRICPFAATCFEGWVEPEPAEVTDPAAFDAAVRLYVIAQQEHEHKRALKGLEEDKRGAKAALTYFMPERGETIVGPYRVKTWPVSGSTTFNAKAMRAAGLDPSPFANVGESRISVKVTKGDTVGDVEYGEDAPF